MKKRFINVGFEFTAAQKRGVRVSNKLKINKTTLEPKSYRNPNLSKYKWINKRFNSDDCGCEISTPIIKNKEDVARYFNEFNSFAIENNLTLNINEAKCGLGGCHIHFGIGFMPRPFRRRFLRNVAIYLTNHPQLNWGFNDPNDNINANTLLTECGLKDSTALLLATSNIENSCYTNYSRNQSLFSANGIYVKNPDAISPLDPFKDENKPLNAFLHDPISIFLKKKFAIRYDEDYKTLEFRVFDMPKTLKQHLLHYEIAMKIFDACYEATSNNIEYTLLYHNWVSYIAEPVEVALVKFDLLMKSLNIDKSRVKQMRENIITRHRWTKIKKNKNTYEYTKVYLY